MAILTAEQLTAWAAENSVTLPGAATLSIAAAIEDVQDFCGRKFDVKAVSQTSKTFYGEGKPSLVLDDLYSASAVTYNGYALATTEYRLEPISGSPPYVYIVRTSSTNVETPAGTYAVEDVSYWGVGKALVITGYWGYGTAVPGKVTEAACLLAACRVMSSAAWRGLGLKGTSVLNVRVDFGNEGIADLRKQAFDLLRPYRRIEPEPQL